MRRLLLWMLCLTALCAGQTAWADDEETDLTSTYLTNPSFESDETSSLTEVTNSADGLRGWTLTEPTGWTVSGTSVTELLVDTTCYTDNNFGLVTTVADGDYAYYLRMGWSTGTTTITQTISSLPAGSYKLSVDHRSGYVNGASSSFVLSAASTSASSVTFTGATTDLTHFPTLAWTTTSVEFTLEEAADVDIAIAITWASGGSCIMIDNFQLSAADDTSEEGDEDEDDDDDEEEDSSTALEFAGPGEYYIYSPDENMYLSWGGDWGTRAILEPAGQPITIAAVGDGTYTLNNPDFSSSVYLFLANAADQAFWDNSYNHYWTITGSEDGEGFYLVNTYNNYYMATTGWVTNNSVYNIGSRDYTYCPIVTVASKDNATKWQLLTADEYLGDAGMTIAKDFNAKTAASLSGISGISSGEELDALLTTENGYYSLDMTSHIANPNYGISSNSSYLGADNGWELQTKYSWSYYSNQKYLKYMSVKEYVDLFAELLSSDTIYGNTLDTLLYLDTAGGMAQTISGLPAGLYKVSTSAIATDIDILTILLNSFDTDDLDGFSRAYAFAKSGSQWSASKAKEYQGEPLSDLASDMTSLSEVYADSVLPLYALDNYVYVGEGEDLDIGLMLPHHTSSSSENVYAYQWTLTYYTDEAYTISSPAFSITDGGYVGVDEFTGTVTATFTTTSIYDDAVISTLIENAQATLTAEDGTVYYGTITVDSLTLTITFSDYVLTAGTTYTITIPEGIIGFDSNNVNAQASITFETKLDIEGAGYLKVAGSENLYMSRGSNYGTRAITDSYGAPVEIAYTDNGVTIHFLDNDLYLFEADADPATIYTDNSTYPYWTVKAVDDGYAIYDGNSTSSNGQPLCYDSSNNLAVIDGGEAIVWTIESIEDHTAYLQSLSDDAAIATAAELGLSVEGKEALAELLADTTIFEASEVSITGKTSSSTTEFYQGTQGSETTVFTETVSGLEEGIYKVSVQAYYRIGSNDVTNTLYFDYNDPAKGAMFLIANDASEQIVSSMSGGYLEAQDTSSSLADYLGSDTLYHPNSTAEGDYAFEQGLYNNDVYAYVGEDGELTFSLKHGINYTPSSWMYYDNFAVTKYALIATLGDSLEYISVDPANGDSVDVLSTITVTYDEEVTLADDETILYVISETGDTITTATLAAEGTDVVITLAEEITGTGEAYTITIPAATIGDATAGSSTFQYGNSNSEFSLNYIVPAIQVVLTLSDSVEQYVNGTYETVTYDFDSSAILAALGASSMDDVSFAILVDGEYDTSYTASYGFYFNSDLEKCSWAADGCAFFAEYYGTGYDYIALGQYPDGCEAGDIYDVSLYFVYGYKAVEIALTYCILETPAVEAEVVATIDVDVNLQEATTYSGDTAEFDVDAVCEALGITDITEAEQYIVNVTDSSYVTNSTDGWRDANGDAAYWDSGDGMVCVKIQDASSGSIDYIGCIDESYSAGDTYTALWAFVYDGKAVIISVNITFVTEEVYTGISSISGNANGTFDATNIYSLSGQLIRTQATSLEGLQQGIYIVNGKKVLVK